MNFFLRLFLLLFIFYTTHVNGQNKHELTVLERKANEAFMYKDYYKSLELFLQLDKYSHNDNRFAYPIGVSYLNLYKHSKALPYLEACLVSAENYPNSLNYYAAKCFQLEYRFEDAMVYYQKYLDGLNTKQREEGLIKEINHEIESCNNAIAYIKSPVVIHIQNLSDQINSEFPEYGGLLSADESTLIFTSNHPNTTGGQVYQQDGTYYEDIYIAHKTNEGWGKPENIGEQINSHHHDASVALSHDGRKLLIYRYKADYLLRQSGNLYVTKHENGAWTKPEYLHSEINSKGWEPSACFSLDDKEIIFASDRKGGYGGTDLYVIRETKKGEWGKPVNLGPEINTPFNEVSPYLHPDGQTFYFSSQGHKSLGGYDVFKCAIDLEALTFGDIQNMGYPLNTPDDDIDFSVSADGKRIYFSDDRKEGYGDKDIYFAELDVKASKLYYLTGFVRDSLNLETCIDAEIYISSKNHDNKLSRISSSGSLNRLGHYTILLNPDHVYEIKFEAEGYILKTIEIDTHDLEFYKEREMDIHMVKSD